MDDALQQEVRRRARSLCEYCQFPEHLSQVRHVVDHIIAKQHGGETVSINLALSCARCNLHKGPNVAGVDPVTNQLTRLFNPRSDDWTAHFVWIGTKLSGKTDVGRTTVGVL